MLLFQNVMRRTIFWTKKNCLSHPVAFIVSLLKYVLSAALIILLIGLVCWFCLAGEGKEPIDKFDPEKQRAKTIHIRPGNLNMFVRVLTYPSASREEGLKIKQIKYKNCLLKTPKNMHNYVHDFSLFLMSLYKRFDLFCMNYLQWSGLKYKVRTSCMGSKLS